MLRDILERALGRESDMELTRDPPQGAGTARAAPDVVMVGAEGVHDEACAATLLARWPDARIISIEARGRRACLYELRPHKIEVGQLSPAGLVGLVRSTARGTAPASARPPCDSGRRQD